jgi:hypothetical protein
MKTPSTPGLTGQPISSKNPGQPQQGRPKNSTDQQKRKERQFTPRTGASLQLWAIDAQEKISDILNPIFLEFYSKKNMRSLSKAEYDESENTKTKIFLSLEPMSTITDEIVLAKLNTVNSIDINLTSQKYNGFIKSISNEFGRQLTSDETKHAKAYFYETVYLA